MSRTQNLLKIISEKKSELLALAKEVSASTSAEGTVNVDEGRYKLAGNRNLKIGDVTLTIGGIAIVGTQPKATVFGKRTRKEADKEYIELITGNRYLVNEEDIYILDFGEIDITRISFVRYGESIDRVVAMATVSVPDYGAVFRYFHVFKLNRNEGDKFVPVKTDAEGNEVTQNGLKMVDMQLEETIDVYALSIPIDSTVTYDFKHTFIYPTFSVHADIERFVTTGRQEHSGIFYFPPPREWYGWDGPSAFPWFINSIDISYGSPSWAGDVIDVNKSYSLIIDENHINPNKRTPITTIPPPGYVLPAAPVYRWEGYFVTLLDFAHRRLEDKNDIVMFVNFNLTGPPDKYVAVPPGAETWYTVSFYKEDPASVAISESDWDNVNVAVCSTQEGVLWKDAESRAYTVSLKNVYRGVGVANWSAIVTFVWDDYAEVVRLAALNPPLAIPDLPPTESYSGTQSGTGIFTGSGGSYGPAPTVSGDDFGSVNVGFIPGVTLEEVISEGPSDDGWMHNIGLVSYTSGPNPRFTQIFNTCPYYASIIGKSAIEHHIISGAENPNGFVMLYPVELTRQHVIVEDQYIRIGPNFTWVVAPYRTSNHLRAATTEGVKAVRPPVFRSVAEGETGRMFGTPMGFSADIGMSTTFTQDSETEELLVIDLISLDAELEEDKVFLFSGIAPVLLGLAPILSMEGEDGDRAIDLYEQFDADFEEILSPANELVSISTTVTPMVITRSGEFLALTTANVTDARARIIS